MAPKADRTYNGIVYDSKAEATYAAGLDVRKRVGDIKDWWRQIRFPLNVNNIHICDYVVDFKLLLSDDTIEYIEIKGYATKDYKIKHKLLSALYPEVKLRVVKV